MKRTETSPVVARVIAWSLRHPQPASVRTVAATLLVAAAALVRMTLITSLLPWLIFMPVTLFVALTMGLRVGLYAVLVSAVAAMLTVEHPGATWWLTGPQWTASVMYVLISDAIVFVAADLRAAFRRAQLQSEEQERTHALLREKEEQAVLLNQELGHRLKNLLSIVQAVANQTLRQATDLRSAADSLSFRLAAFGRAADVLTASTWDSADLHTLAVSALSSHGGMEERYQLTGPPIRFNAQVSLALALALHELSTNAVKYGALSNDAGHVDLHWSILKGPDPADARFRLTWREIGGPPVAVPRRSGFGSVMIERALRSYLKGEVSVDYAPDGLRFHIDAPLSGAQVQGDPTA